MNPEKLARTKRRWLLPLMTLQGVLVLAVSSAYAATSVVNSVPTFLPAPGADSIGGQGLNQCQGLASMIQTGSISLRDIPCFIKFFSQTLVGLAGSLSLLFVMIGGYHYVIGGEEAKEKAKHTIMHALMGLGVTLLAWILVGLALQLATE